MRISTRLLPLGLVLMTAPLRADDASRCLLFHPVILSGTYTGAAASPGDRGGVVDSCERFGSGSPFVLSGTNRYLETNIEPQMVYLSEVASSFGFWVGAKSLLAFRFFLGDEEQHATGRFAVGPRQAGWWEWRGAYDRVEVTGAHVLLLTVLNEPTLPPEESVIVEPTAEEEFVEELNAVVLTDPSADEQILADTSTVPEPATMTLLATGLVGLAGAARRRRKV